MENHRHRYFCAIIIGIFEGAKYGKKEYSVYELNRIQQYIMQMRPVFEEGGAIFGWNKKITAIRRNRGREKR